MLDSEKSTIYRCLFSMQLTPPAKSPITGEYGLKSKFNTNVLLPGAIAYTHSNPIVGRECHEQEPQSSFPKYCKSISANMLFNTPPPLNEKRTIPFTRFAFGVEQGLVGSIRGFTAAGQTGIKHS
ncbi:hypothetical protein T12_10948 [Trichinella patagoniensis]|uniref:Uncharacterized protein n=1 Tax=Trichinella patagoniensis TaxID=990121 RepID=A0A0V0ZNX6_9BILA|nr:hypothetical protein T12_10948 [Trichinella patagoniensis]